MTDERPHIAKSDAGDKWATPPHLVDPLREAIGDFDLDPASGSEPKPYAETRYTKEDDGLAQDWFGHVWLNPPYSRTQNPRWGEKAWRERERERVKSITALVPASTAESWWQSYYADFEAFCFLEGRVQFIGDADHGASFRSVICVYGKDELPKEYFIELERKGTLLSPMDSDDRSLFEL